nr:hypothetical protein [Tanacetum cinerariifolium]
MGSIRCLALEKVIETVIKSPYNWPYAYSKCSVTGNIPELVTHLKKTITMLSFYDGFEFTFVYKLSHWLGIKFKGLPAVDAHFLGNDTYFIAFRRFMGEDIEAKEFRYSLEMGVDGRELKLQVVPKSIQDTSESL